MFLEKGNQRLNLFYPNDLFLDPLKASENQRFSDIFTKGFLIFLGGIETQWHEMG